MKALVKAHLWPGAVGLSLNLSRCFVVQTNSLIVEHPAVDRKESRLPATAIEAAQVSVIMPQLTNKALKPKFYNSYPSKCCFLPVLLVPALN